jgi:hypothetical protein
MAMFITMWTCDRIDGNKVCGSVPNSIIRRYAMNSATISVKMKKVRLPERRSRKVRKPKTSSATAAATVTATPKAIPSGSGSPRRLSAKNIA